MGANPLFGNVYVPVVALGFLLAYPYLCHIAIRAKVQWPCSCPYEQCINSLKKLDIRHVLVQVLFLHKVSRLHEVSYALNAAAKSTLYIYGTLHPESSKLKRDMFLSIYPRKDILSAVTSGLQEHDCFNWLLLCWCTSLRRLSQVLTSPYYLGL